MSFLFLSGIVKYGTMLGKPSAFCGGFFYFKNKFVEVSAVDNRIAAVGIVVEDLESANEVNAVLHEYSDIVVGRMGIPYRERGLSVISLIVDGNSDQISAMTGKLGKIKAVSVKSAMTKKG